MAKKDTQIAEDEVVETEAVEGVGEKRVSIRLPLTKENQAPVFIRVNGRTWLVKRGETVELPECAIEVLEHSEQAMLENIEYINAHEK